MLCCSRHTGHSEPTNEGLHDRRVCVQRHTTHDTSASGGDDGWTAARWLSSRLPRPSHSWPNCLHAPHLCPPVVCNVTWRQPGTVHWVMLGTMDVSSNGYRVGVPHSTCPWPYIPHMPHLCPLVTCERGCLHPDTRQKGSMCAGARLQREGVGRWGHGVGRLSVTLSFLFFVVNTTKENS